MSKIPVTVLTGFLGSGKTTLLNRILTEHHGQRIAVIENEFGEIGIDQALVINADEEVFEMNNGCICCTVRGDLIRILGNLVKRRDKFDRIVLETTGMADPGPVAQTFFMDDEIREQFHLDGIVTLVDTHHVALHLEDSSECREQIAFADVLVLNKCDLVDPPTVDALEQRVRSMNAMAKIVRSEHAQVDLATVLDVGGFDLDRAIQMKPTFLDPEYPFEWSGVFDLTTPEVRVELEDGPDESLDLVWLPTSALTLGVASETVERANRVWAGEPTQLGTGQSLTVDTTVPVTLDLSPAGAKAFAFTLPAPGRYALFSQHHPSEFDLRVLTRDTVLDPVVSEDFAAGHTHDDEVGSVGIQMAGDLHPEKLNAWLSRLLREQGNDIFRMKGILSLAGSPNRFVFQGVHMLFDGQEDRPWGEAQRVNNLVFIGRKLDREMLNREFRACLA